MKKLLTLLTSLSCLALVSAEIRISLDQKETEVWAVIENSGTEPVSLIAVFTEPLFAIQIEDRGEFGRPAFMVDADTKEPFEKTIQLQPKEKRRIDLHGESPLTYDFIQGTKRIKYVYEIIPYPIWDFKNERRITKRIESNILEVDLNLLRHNQTVDTTAFSAPH